MRHNERAFNKHLLDRLTIQQLRPKQRTRQIYYLHTEIITRTDCEWLAAEGRQTIDSLQEHEFFTTAFKQRLWPIERFRIKILENEADLPDCRIYNNIIYFVAIMETSPEILTVTQIHTTISPTVYMRIKHSEGACMKKYILNMLALPTRPDGSPQFSNPPKKKKEEWYRVVTDGNKNSGLF